MGILKPISDDIEKLIDFGYTDREISIAVDTDLSLIQHIINFFRQETHRIAKTNKNKKT
jgi:hypothetical protein